MPCVYYAAATLDGCIVDEKASLDWLISRNTDPDGPFNIEPFMETIGALVMGADTYEWIVANPAADAENVDPADGRELGRRLSVSSEKQ